MIDISISRYLPLQLFTLRTAKVAVAALLLHPSESGKSRRCWILITNLQEDFNQINKRSLFTFQLGWNYERIQASGYLYMILPQLRKMWGWNSWIEKKWWGFILNSSILHHSSHYYRWFWPCHGRKKMVWVQKMPLTVSRRVWWDHSLLLERYAIFGSLVPAIMGSIAATPFIAGQPWGIFLWITFAVAYDLPLETIEFAYKERVGLINNMQRNTLIDAASVPNCLHDG